MIRNRLALGAATTALALTVLGGVAHADDPAGNGCSVVCPTTTTSTTTSTIAPGDVMPNNEVAPNGPVAVLPAVQANSAAPAVAAATASPVSHGATLPLTGGDVLGLTVIGLGALGGGTLLVRRSRKHA